MPFILTLARPALGVDPQASPLSPLQRLRSARRHLPFQLMPTARTYERAYCSPVTSPSWPKPLSRLLESCCALNAAERPTAEAAAARLAEYGGGEEAAGGPGQLVGVLGQVDRSRLLTAHGRSGTSSGRRPPEEEEEEGAGDCDA